MGIIFSKKSLSSFGKLVLDVYLLDIPGDVTVFI
jgi:hypothetical protein